MRNFLIVKEEPQKADVIIVLGGSLDRVPYAAKLYKLSFAPKVLLSGSGRYMMRQALSQGIPESSILLENRSLSTFENAKYSLKIMQDQGYKSAIIVTSPYHTRRVSIIFAQFFKEIHLTICPVPYDPAITHGWLENFYSIQFFISEYEKLVWHYLFEWH
jgi:uncharacterized SAM-binding protein YcdF (DUF218 family)